VSKEEGKSKKAKGKRQKAKTKIGGAMKDFFIPQHFCFGM
jgi:hypothetical protein